ncbi:MAG TPA: hypothetical protein VIP09_07650 [Dehalococcoidia bacterium]
MKPPTTIPEPVARVAELMASFGPTWYLCGGWAVDAWLGKVTREHGDLDITVFEDAEPALFKHLADWQMVAHDGEFFDGGTAEPWNGRPLTLPAHIHARAPEDRTDMPDRVDNAAKQGFGLEIVINARTDTDWILNREPSVTLPLDRCSGQSPWGWPTALPEVLLFFKATAYAGTHNYLRRRDHLDFERLLVRLTPGQRSWLHEAISIIDLDHPWLGVLSL